MTAHLQRLFDAAALTPIVSIAQPAQRSSSPLVAVDQRLATAAYAGSFRLGVPGDPHGDAVTDPAPGAETVPATDSLSVSRRPAPAVTDVDELLPPNPARGQLADVSPIRRDGRSTDELPGLPPDRVAQMRVVSPDPGRSTRQVDPVSVPARDSTAWASRLTAPVAPAAPPAVAAPTSPRPFDAVPRIHARAMAAHVVEPSPAVAVEPAPGTNRVRQAVAPATERDDQSAVAPLLHPSPAALPEPLPPRPTDTRWTDVAAQVRRLVREEMSAATSVPRVTPDPERSSVPPTERRPPRPSTAEAVSVIGPLDRPARHTSLYGLRLR